MVSIPDKPTISCPAGGVPTAVVTTYKGGIFPITSVDVEFRGLNIPYVGQDIDKQTTNILGIAQTCTYILTYVEVWVKKSGIDFGNGTSNWKKVGSTRPTSAVLYKISSLTPAPGELPVITLPPMPACVGEILADVPNISNILSSISSPPTSIPITIRTTGSKSLVPMRVLVDGNELERKPTNYYGIDAVRVLESARVNINTSHTIKIESTLADCDIKPATINIPALIPSGLPTPPPFPTCSQVATFVENISHPMEIIDFNSTFYVYIRGIKEACKSDPTNPQFISKLPKGTKGTITLGNLSKDFYLTDDGILDIDLSRMIDLKSLSGQSFGNLPQPSIIQQPTIISKPTTPTIPTAPWSLQTVQAWLPLGYRAEPSSGFGGANSLKIIRPDGTFFYANKWSGLLSYIK